MKKNCDIVQDLLFGYQDGSLKEGSKEFVEKHLSTCEKCNKVWNEMKKQEQEENTEQANIEIEYLKKVNNKMKRKNKIILSISIIITIIILFNIAVLIQYYKVAGTIKIYLNTDVTEEQISVVEQKIREVDNNAEIEYKSKEQALEEMKEKFNENANLLSGYEGDNNIFSPYLVVKTKHSNVEEIEHKLEQVEGIKKIYIHSGNIYEVVMGNII